MHIFQLLNNPEWLYRISKGNAFVAHVLDKDKKRIKAALKDVLFVIYQLKSHGVITYCCLSYFGTFCRSLMGFWYLRFFFYVLTWGLSFIWSILVAVIFRVLLKNAKKLQRLRIADTKDKLQELHKELILHKDFQSVASSEILWNEALNEYHAIHPAFKFLYWLA